MNERMFRRGTGQPAMQKPARWREYLAIVLVVAATLLALALVTYDESDVGSYISDQRDARCGNLIGPVGAYVSYGMFQAFGVSVYVFPALLAVLAVFTFMRMTFPAAS